MTRPLAARIERLEAAKQSLTKVRGVIGGDYGKLIPDLAKPGHLKWSQPPGGFAVFAMKQQSDLLALLRTLADTEGPQDAQTHVGTDHLAPLPAGKKRPRYLEIHGREIDAFTFTRN